MSVAKRMTYAQAGAAALAQAMRDDPRVIALGEDVGRGGIFGQYAGLQAEFGADRVVDTSGQAEDDSFRALRAAVTERGG